MKIRTGFVSNSSATSFYFLLNGGKKELLALIMKYRVFFDFDGDKHDEDVFNRGMDVEDLISAIRGLGRIKSANVETGIIESRKRVGDYMKRSCEEYGENKNSSSEMYYDAAEEECDLLSELERSKEKGLCNMIRIDIGDNDGAISGGIVGNVMDYRGRHINIDKKDFRVFTRQNR
jgi:hypothetical protein